MIKPCLQISKSEQGSLLIFRLPLRRFDNDELHNEELVLLCFTGSIWFLDADFLLTCCPLCCMTGSKKGFCDTDACQMGHSIQYTKIDANWQSKRTVVG